MKRETIARKPQRSAGSLLFWTFGILLIFVLLSTWMVCGLFAKYIISSDAKDSGRVAGTGVVDFRVLEHEAVNVSAVKYDRVYDLLDGKEGRKNEEVTKNTYNMIPPGYDLPKDPFVRLELKDAEVDYNLYLKVVKSVPFPDTVSFELTEEWKLVDEKENIYQYIGSFSDRNISDGHIDAGTLVKTDIYILKNNEIKISDRYKGEFFTVSFEAYLKQVD